MALRRNDSTQSQGLAQVKYLGGALLIHAALGLLLVGFNWRTQQAVIPQLAIKSVLVDRNALNQLARQPAPPSPPAEPQVDEKQLAEQRRQLQEQARQQELKQQQLKQEQLKQEQLKQAQLQQQTQEKERQRAADAVKQQQEAEKKRVADIQQKQREAEAKRQAEAEAKAQTAKEAELKAQLAAEEGRANAVNAGLLNQYVALIQQKVMRNWIKPPTAKPGLECEVKVAQSTNGTVLSVEVGRCNGDGAVRTSIEQAVQAASPLPLPPDARLFERNLLFIFKPTE